MKIMDLQGRLDRLSHLPFLNIVQELIVQITDFVIVTVIIAIAKKQLL